MRMYPISIYKTIYWGNGIITQYNREDGSNEKIGHGKKQACPNYSTLGYHVAFLL